MTIAPPRNRNRNIQENHTQQTQEPWKIKKENGETLGEIKTVTNYKYLGINLNSNNRDIFKKHRDKIQSEVKETLSPISDTLSEIQESLN